jgi:hypothetical protein
MRTDGTSNAIYFVCVCVCVCLCVCVCARALASFFLAHVDCGKNGGFEAERKTEKGKENTKRKDH